MNLHDDLQLLRDAERLNLPLAQSLARATIDARIAWTIARAKTQRCAELTRRFEESGERQE